MSGRVTPLVLTGESHLACLAKAVDAAGSNAFPHIAFWPLGRGGVAVTPFFEHDAAAGVVRIVDPEWKKHPFSVEGVRIEGEAAVLVVSMPLNTSRILRDYSWHTHVPWRLRNSSDEVALSDAVVQAMFDQDSLKAVAFVEALSQVGLRVAVMEGPRFFEKAPYLRRSRFEVIAHVDWAYRARVRRKLEFLDIPIIDQPAETISERGCTRPEYAHEDPNDVHHGNAAYGDLMMNAIAEVVARRYGEAAPPVDRACAQDGAVTRFFRRIGRMPLA